MSAPSSSSSPQDWMVLQCQACGARMKSRRSVARDAYLLCPECRMPVAVPLPEGEILPPEAAAAPGPDPDFTPRPLPPSPRAQGSGSASPSGKGARSGGGMALPGYRDGTVFDGGTLPSHIPPRASGLPPEEEFAAHPVFDGSAADSGPEESDEAGWTGEDQHSRPQGERRARIKKRRRKNENTYVELTDWDQKDLSRIPEAEVEADTWRKAVPMPEDMFLPEVGDFVVQTGGGQAARKKVRRKAKGSRYFFLQFTRFSTFLIVALGVLLAGVGVYGFSQLKKGKDYVPPPAPVAAEDETLDRRVLTASDVTGAEQAVRSFLAADGVEAKLPFVRQPKRIAPLMQKWYETHSATPLTAGEVAMQQKTGGEVDSPGYFVMLALPVLVPDPLNPGQTLEEMTFFSVEEIRKDGVSTYLVDWETSTGYQEMPLEVFKSTMPKEAHTFRVSLKPGDYYNHGFEEKDWQCYNLTYPGRDFQIWGYLRRNSPDGRVMELKLENGWTGNMAIAELQYPESATSRDQVVITHIIQHSWYLPDADAPKGTPKETVGESGK